MIISGIMMHNLIKSVRSYFTDRLRGRTDGWTDSYNIMCTHAVRAILFKLLAHALHAPMRVNVTSVRIPTHPGIKVKYGNLSEAVPSHEKSGKLKILSLVWKLSPLIFPAQKNFSKLGCMNVACKFS